MIFRQILLTCSIRNAWGTIRRICISISGLKVLSGGSVFNLSASRILFLFFPSCFCWLPPLCASSIAKCYAMLCIFPCSPVSHHLGNPSFSSRFPYTSASFSPVIPPPVPPPPQTHTYTTPLKNLNCMLTDSCCVICILEVGVVMVQRVRVKTLQTPE